MINKIMMRLRRFRLLPGASNVVRSSIASGCSRNPIEGRGEPGGTRTMAACEPGQGGNAAAINNAFMCPGAPPRFTPPLGRRGSARVDPGFKAQSAAVGFRER